MTNTTDTATRRLRIGRLLGTDETKGTRGDLARALRSKALGFTTAANGLDIDVAIATLEAAKASYERTLSELGQ